MGVLIKGMDMPLSCTVCKFSKSYGCVGDRYCIILEEYFTGNLTPPYKERPDCCPLSEVPTPHGDLIDKDILYIKLDNALSGEGSLWRAEQAVSKVPTIIEAEDKT